MSSAKGRVHAVDCFSDHWSKFLSCAQSSLYLSLLILKLNQSGISRKFVNHWFYLFITGISNFKFYQDFLICKTRKRETFYNFLLIFPKGGRKLSISNLISFANKIGTRGIHTYRNLLNIIHIPGWTPSSLCPEQRPDKSWEGRCELAPEDHLEIFKNSLALHWPRMSFLLAVKCRMMQMQQLHYVQR